jgi:hypothetical protein
MVRKYIFCIVAGILLLGVLRWLGLSIPSAAFLFSWMGEPTILTGIIALTIVALNAYIGFKLASKLSKGSS